MIGDWLLDYQQLLRWGQWAFLAFEFAAILALSRNRRVRMVVLSGILGLHVFTYLTIGIHFLPHSVFLLAFLPLERLVNRSASDPEPVDVTVGRDPTERPKLSHP